MINKAIIVGNLGQDPELRHTSGGTAVCNFSVATSRKYKAKDETWKEDTQWHKIIVWGKQGESCAEYLSKGRQVYVEGRIENRSWEDKEGNKRYTTEIVADNVKFLGGKDGGGGKSGGRGEVPPPSEDDLPF
jgi:single-strand DNA-binding protein